eukprot:3875305-Rhodomonas_salina.1
MTTDTTALAKREAALGEAREEQKEAKGERTAHAWGRSWCGCVAHAAVRRMCGGWRTLHAAARDATRDGCT